METPNVVMGGLPKAELQCNLEGFGFKAEKSGEKFAHGFEKYGRESNVPMSMGGTFSLKLGESGHWGNIIGRVCFGDVSVPTFEVGPDFTCLCCLTYRL